LWRVFELRQSKSSGEHFENIYEPLFAFARKNLGQKKNSQKNKKIQERRKNTRKKFKQRFHFLGISLGMYIFKEKWNKFSIISTEWWNLWVEVSKTPIFLENIESNAQISQQNKWNADQILCDDFIVLPKLAIITITVLHQ
jgi:hypothetical protein